MSSLTLLWQPAKKKENSLFKPVKIDLMSHFAHVEKLVNAYILARFFTSLTTVLFYFDPNHLTILFSHHRHHSIAASMYPSSMNLVTYLAQQNFCLHYFMITSFPRFLS